MAFAHVQTKQQSPTAATRLSGVTLSSETFAATPTIGNLVILYIGFFSSGAAVSTLTSVTDNQGTPNAWTIEKNVFDGVHNNGVAIAWAIITTASGTFTVRANFSANSDTCIGISEFSGVVSSSPVDGSNSGTGTGFGPAGGSITPSASGDLFVSAVSDDSLTAKAFTIPSGWDGKRAENSTAGGGTGECMTSASKIATDASAQSSTWASDTSINWQAAVVAFKAAGGGGGGGSSVTGATTPWGYYDRYSINAAWYEPWGSNPASEWDLVLEDPAGGTSIALSGIIAGTSSITATLTETAALSGSILGQGTLTGTLAEAVALSGSISGQGTLAATLREALALAGSISGQGTLTATLAEALALTGALAGQAALTGALAEALALSGTVAGVAAITGTMVESLALAGALHGTADIEALLSEAVSLSGAIVGQATLAGKLRIPTGAAAVTYIFIFDD